ncbi:MAG: glutamine synthetase, partial [Candidatus Berkiellales bacterium]
SFTAMMMAGLDGIRQKIHPGKPMDKDLYELTPEESAELGTVADTLPDALNALNQDRAFLKEGGVFSDDLIDNYISVKKREVQKLHMTTHPVEFEMYYSL